VVDPISRKSSVNNVGNYIPYVEYKPFSTDYIEVTAVTKGGGSELFILQPTKVVLLADGIRIPREPLLGKHAVCFMPKSNCQNL